MTIAANGMAFIEFTAEITFTCGYCGKTIAGTYAFPRRMEFKVPLPDGWDERHGRPVCPRHEVLVYTAGPMREDDDDEPDKNHAKP